MKSFDLLLAPLVGTNLIEASAGTGKTYTIAGLFLRLLLEKNLTVDQILVVTFTKAATEELKGRIRTKLLDARRAFTSGSSSDDAVLKIVSRVNHAETGLAKIQDALRDFDSTAIYTIHGFCHRILNDHAFETGDRFDTELMTEPTPLLTSVADDFWRRRFYNASPEFIQYALKKIKTPAFFYTLLQKTRHPGMRVIPAVHEPEINQLEEFSDQLIHLRLMWPNVKIEIREMLKDARLSGVVYGGFKEDKKTTGMTVRESRVLALVRQMDRFVEEETPELPLWQGFEKFTAAKIEASVKKGQASISHPFFSCCENLQKTAQRLTAEMDVYLVYLKSECLKFGEKELLKRKKHQNVQFFDDLLVMVQKALKERKGNALAANIRRRYRAALVDEFQDTDLVQYEIFTRIFSKKDRPLFMIGDPKQAIYSFRGADVFSYMKASTQAENKYTLYHNYRSTPEMITAVNSLFSNMVKPFVFEEIPFGKGMPGKRLMANKITRGAPFNIWYLSPQGGRSLTVQDARHVIVQAVTGEIAHLIGDDASRVDPGEIAVLVRTNREAFMVKESLSQASIPAVIYSAGNIMDSPESDDMANILLSISNPKMEGLLKAALSTDMLGGTAAALDPGNMADSWWEKQTDRFMAYHRLWHESGFMAMFRHFMNLEGGRRRLLSLPHGERRLTNVLHLSEILHTVSMEKSLGMTGLLKWYFIQKDPDTPRNEVHQLRLESDADAVKVITIHKSKGLEFPIVFCPFAWGQSQMPQNDFAFHDMDADRRITFDLGSQKIENHRIMAQNELLAENLRLLYVAVTRAIERCYLVWPRLRYTETSALAYLFHAYGAASSFETSGNLIARLRDVLSNLDPETFIGDMQRLEKKSEGSISVAPLPSGDIPTVVRPLPDKKNLRLRTFSRNIDKSWRVSSYSSLVSGRTLDHELPDRDALTEIQGHDDVPPLEGASEDVSATGEHAIFSFPKGAASGIFFHDILEHLDFSNQALDYRRGLVTSKLAVYGYDPVWMDPIVQMLDNLTTVTLSSEMAEFSLASVGNTQRLNEMAFYFPLKKLTPGTFVQVYSQFVETDILKGLPEIMEGLTFSPAMGLMKGYLDVLFQHEDRFYIVDWKSNFLGMTLESYQRKHLNVEMQKTFYVLQYHLYVLATHLHLKMKMPGYTYENNFGGVFYLFLRGVDAKRGSEYGVFQDRPDIRLVDTLGEALIPNYEKS
jgi:exodeoxyribonuclease V beta subunit